MRRLSIVILALIGILASTDSALAGVGIKPDPTVPGVRLDAIKKPRPTAPATGLRRPTREVGDPSNPERRFLCARQSSGRCRLGGSFSIPLPQPAEEGEQPQLTVGDILRAAREIGLPSLRVRVQPGAETLVNVPTIFSTQPQPFRRSVDLLGFDVDLAAEPVSFRWVHGDGTSATTSSPGRPYPAMDVTHRYRAPDDEVSVRVDVTYEVRYRVDGGAWSGLGETLTASGPSVPLEVKEAAPVLTAR
jgi:hypothetical protein